MNLEERQVRVVGGRWRGKLGVVVRHEPDKTPRVRIPDRVAPVPISARHLKVVGERPVAPSGPVRPFTRERPPRSAPRPKAEGRTGGVAERFRRWVRTLPCAWCGRPGPSEANHEPRRGMDGGKRDDLDVVPLCAGPNGCHAVVTRTNRLGSMTPEDTKRWLERMLIELLKRWIRKEGRCRPSPT